MLAIEKVTSGGKQSLLGLKELTMSDFPPKMPVLATWYIHSEKRGFEKQEDQRENGKRESAFLLGEGCFTAERECSRSCLHGSRHANSL
jgi:hypothetical protein